jgi:thiamine-monophosphate kinase
MAETLKTVGEFGLIRRIRSLLEREGAGRPSGLTIGIGDDTAAFKPGAGHEILVTCDSLVEGRHYLPRFMRPRDLGRRAMVLNVSDVGAMGGRPLYALVSLGLRGETPLENVEEMYRGFLDELNPFGAAIIGGNLTGIEHDTFIDVTLIGEAEEGRVLRRSGARPGDLILVTGYPGESSAGLQMLLNGLAALSHPLVARCIRPSHRAVEGAAVAGSGHASSMIDTSDGFLGDLGHICEESGVGAELTQQWFPISQNLRDAATSLNEDPYKFFLGPSDDYELIITCAPQDFEAIRVAVSMTYNGPLTEVGRITEPGFGLRLLLADGSTKTLTPEGWDHFRARTPDSPSQDMT